MFLPPLCDRAFLIKIFIYLLVIYITMKPIRIVSMIIVISLGVLMLSALSNADDINLSGTFTTLAGEINKKALHKAIRYSKIELKEDFQAKSLRVMDKIPLYSPQGKLIYYYVLFQDKSQRIYFSMVSVSYKYAPVICEGSGYGYISQVIERARGYKYSV